MPEIEEVTTEQSLPHLVGDAKKLEKKIEEIGSKEVDIALKNMPDLKEIVKQEKAKKKKEEKEEDTASDMFEFDHEEKDGDDEDGAQKNKGKEEEEVEVEEIGGEEEEEEEDNFEMRDKFTKPDYMPPPPREIPRPTAVFDPNLAGLWGFVACGINLYIISTVGEFFRENGVDVVVNVATSVYICSALWTFTSNLEGWTRYPVVTYVFVTLALFPIWLNTLFTFDPWSDSFETGALYASLVYGPLIYIAVSCVFAVANGRNEVAHGFKGHYFE